MLVRRMGPEHLGIAEDAVQDAFVAAARLWSMRGVPPNPSAWLTRVSWNRALDALRRVRPAPLGDELLVEGIGSSDDDELRMLFLCCHPGISTQSQILLMLRELSGLSTKECAAGLLMSEEAAAQRLVRAKADLRRSGSSFEIGFDEMTSRLPTVLKALHLLFTEGYACATKPEVASQETCDEAILLADRLSTSSVGDVPATHALVALMLLQSSRLPARLADPENVCLLEDQDRSLWDRERIEEGMRRLARASSGDKISRYHLEAGIAAIHAFASSFEATDWDAILELYTQLAELEPSPVTLLNRAVALAYAIEPEAGLRQLDVIAHDKTMGDYYWFEATRARLLEMAGRSKEAIEAYDAASRLTLQVPYQNFIEGRRNALVNSIIGDN